MLGGDILGSFLLLDGQSDNRNLRRTRRRPSAFFETPLFYQKTARSRFYRRAPAHKKTMERTFYLTQKN
jgi:hypothetical protein